MATTFGRILVRRDTAANWNSSNPVLANGEPAWDSTNKVLKVGDGVTTWTSLPAITAGGGGVSLPTGGTTGQVLIKNSNTSGDAGWSNTALVAANAVKLQTARTIAGQSFDGTANVTIATTNLTDYSTTLPVDLVIPQFDSDSQKYIPRDLSETFAVVDSAGRLDASAWQKYFTPTVIVDEGAAAPADFPVGGIVFEREAPVSLVPTFAGAAFLSATAGSTVAVTTTAAFAVGDWIGIAVGFDGTTPPGTLPTLISSITPATGAWTVTSGPTNFQLGTAQVNLEYAKVTTLIPSGTVITLTMNQVRTHRLISVFKMPNLTATTPLDVSTTGTGASSATLSLSVGPTSTTTQADELAVAAWVHNDSTTATRPLVGTNGWTILSATESDNGTNSRTLTVLYKVLAATGTQTATVNVNASDGSTGAWAGALATFKAV